MWKTRLHICSYLWSVIDVLAEAGWAVNNASVDALITRVCAIVMADEFTKVVVDALTDRTFFVDVDTFVQSTIIVVTAAMIALELIVTAGAVINMGVSIAARVDMLDDAVIDALVGILAGVIINVLPTIGFDALPGLDAKVSTAMITVSEIIQSVSFEE